MKSLDLTTKYILAQIKLKYLLEVILKVLPIWVGQKAFKDSANCIYSHGQKYRHPW